MSFYVAPPSLGSLPTLLVPGQTGYAFGSFNDRVPTTKMFVSQSAAAGGTVTLTVSVWEGLIPSVGDLVTTSELSLVSNVTNVALTNVTIDAVLGTGTIQFAGAGTVVTAADSGLALVPQREKGDATPAFGSPAVRYPYTSKAFALAALNETNARSINWSVSFPATGPSTTFEADLQVATVNSDASFFTVDKITSTSGGSQQYTPISQANFVRIKIVANDNATQVIGRVSI